MNKILSILLTSLLAFTLPAAAQTNASGGQNVIQYKQFEWKKVSTENFDVFFYTADPVLANISARYAEEALFDISDLLDFKNRARFALYLYTSSSDLVQSNQFPAFQSKNGGTTPIRNNTAPVVFPGTSRQHSQLIKTTVTQLMMEDFYYGGSVQAMIQNAVLLHVPDWYREGFSAYVGEGWSYEDELWITSLENESLIDFVMEGQGHLQHVARKSIWYYIVNQYGKEKLSEIFFMTRLTRSVEAGIVHVLGITLKTLTERWREFILGRITENHTFRNPYREKGTALPLPNRNDKLLGMAVNPTQPLAALFLQREGLQRVELYDFKTGKYSPTPIEGGFRTDQFDLMQDDRPVAWSHDGKYLLTTIYRKGQDKMAFYTHQANTVDYVRFQPGIEKIYEINWAHDNQRAVLSGLAKGSVDLFSFTPGKNKFKPLTQDPFDNRFPVWSYDDQTLYYASNRHSDTLFPASMGVEIARSTFDIYKIPAEGAEKGLERLTQTPEFNEYSIYTPNSFELAYISDQSGIPNVKKQNVFLGEISSLSNLTQGTWRVSMSDSLFAFTTPVKGNLQAWYAPAEDFSTDLVVLDSRLRLVDRKARQKKAKALLLEQKRDSIRQAREEALEKGTTIKSDSNTSETKKVKFYVFDEEDDGGRARQTKRKALRAKSRLAERNKVTRPDFSNVEVSSPQSAKAKWAADRVVNELSFDPVFKWNILFGAGFKTLDGNHRLSVEFRPFFDLRNSDLSLRYERLKGKLDLYGAFEWSGRFLNRNGYFLRYRSSTLRVGGILPINRYLSVGLGLNAAYLRRINLNLLVPGTLNGTDLVGGLSANLMYDRREIQDNFVRSGYLISVDATNAMSVGSRSLLFNAVSIDARKYQRVMRNMVFAGRITGGLSLGSREQELYMGGLEDQLFSSFSNSGELPIDQGIGDFYFMRYLTPVRGFQYNARNGSKYFSANAELRMPLSRLFSNSLNSNPAFNLELIPFFDIGTVWRQGNPFSQKNPIETEVINQYPLVITVQTLKSPFIMGFGSGIRSLIFGYSMRLDLAWGVEDYTILKPRVHVSIGKNF